jgi:serine/threonine protein phosphatase PrpC
MKSRKVRWQYDKDGSMLAEFKSIYALNQWLRYVTWLGLLALTMFLLWASGGFPPQAWFLLVQLLIQLPAAWSVQGGAILLPLLLLLVLSLVWLLLWAMLAWVGVSLIGYHVHSSPDVTGQWYNYLGQDMLRRLFAHNTKLVRSISHISLPSWPSLHAKGATPMETLSPLATPRLRLPQRYQSDAYQPDPSPSPIPPTTAHAITAAQPAVQSPQPRPSYPVSTGSLDTTRGMVVPQTLPPPTLQAMTPVQTMAIGIGWNTGIKRKRNPNEDSVVAIQSTCNYHEQLIPFGLFVVADGMGGHDYGQEASKIAMQTMMHTVLQNIVMGNELNDEFLTDMLVGGVQWANQLIFERGAELGKEMGTTLTAALVVGRRAYVVNVGDSRTYLYREGFGLTQVTRDHSLVATLVAFGEITPDEIYTHPERNKVYRSLGTKQEVEVDWFVLELQRHDTLLLCSDGLWEMVRDPQIAQILYSNQPPNNSPQRSSDALVQAALLGGGSDNVSVIVASMP